MNGLYGISLAENAINTQEFLSKIILFLKYYTSDEFKLVRFKDELAVIRLFIEMMSTSTGNHNGITINVQDNEILNFYFPSKSLLLLIMDIFVLQKDAVDEQGCIFIEACRIEHKIVISIVSNNFSDICKIQQRIVEMKKAFEGCHGPEVEIVSGSREKDVLEIKIALFSGESL